MVVYGRAMFIAFFLLCAVIFSFVWLFVWWSVWFVCLVCRSCLCCLCLGRGFCFVYLLLNCLFGSLAWFSCFLEEQCCLLACLTGLFCSLKLSLEFSCSSGLGVSCSFLLCLLSFDWPFVLLYFAFVCFVCLFVSCLFFMWLVAWFLSRLSRWTVAWCMLTGCIAVVAVSAQVRHDISWFDQESNAVGVLTSRLEAEASAVRKPSKHLPTQ